MSAGGSYLLLFSMFTRKKMKLGLMDSTLPLWLRMPTFSVDTNGDFRFMV